MYEEYDSIGARVAMLIRESGMTQAEVAEQLEGFGVSVSSGHVNAVKLDKRRPSVELLVAMTQLFETTSDFILCLSDKRARVSDSDDEEGALKKMAEREEKASAIYLLDLFSKMESHDRVMLTQIAERFLSLVRVGNMQGVLKSVR